MSFVGSSKLNQTRSQVQSGNVTSPKPKPTPKPIIPSVSPKLGAALGAGAAVGGIGYGLHKSLSGDEDKLGEMGTHFEKSFSNITGVHEDSAGITVAADSAPAPYVGTKPFKPLVDKYPNVGLMNKLRKK